MARVVIVGLPGSALIKLEELYPYAWSWNVRQLSGGPSFGDNTYRVTLTFPEWGDGLKDKVQDIPCRFRTLTIDI